jgi:glutamyl-Q tRNA(Asp) synthetase
VIVDDYFQGITQVVRGADLLDSTFRQLRLQNALHFQPPEYMHLPIVLSEDGRKLGKRFDADPVRHENPAIAVAQALGFLGQNPPRDLSLSALWDWAMRHWDRSNICSQQA